MTVGSRFGRCLLFGLLAGPTLADAQPENGVARPLFIGRFVRACSDEPEANGEARRVLKRMGETLPPLPGEWDLSATCGLLSTAERLGGSAGYLVGGQFARSAQDGTATAYVLDLSASRALLARMKCPGCDSARSVGPLVSSLVQQLASPSAPWIPVRTLSTCVMSNPANVAGPAQQAHPAQYPLPALEPTELAALSVRAPKHLDASSRQVRTAVRRQLQEMGMQVKDVHVAMDADDPRSALKGVDSKKSLIDIRLSEETGEKKTSADSVLLRLFQPERNVQTQLDCTIQECSGPVLGQMAKDAVAHLVDTERGPGQPASTERIIDVACLPPTDSPQKPVHVPSVLLRQPLPPIGLGRRIVLRPSLRSSGLSLILTPIPSPLSRRRWLIPIGGTALALGALGVLAGTLSGILLNDQPKPPALDGCLDKTGAYRLHCNFDGLTLGIAIAAPSAAAALFGSILVGFGLRSPQPVAQPNAKETEDATKL